MWQVRMLWCHDKFIGWPGGLFSAQNKIKFWAHFKASWPKNVSKNEKKPKIRVLGLFSTEPYLLWASSDANVGFFSGSDHLATLLDSDMVHDLKIRQWFFFCKVWPPLSFSISWSQPRANEAGGMYGKGVIARKYQKNQASSQSLFP